MRFNKRNLLSALCIICMLVLVACGQNSQSTGGQTAAVPNDKGKNSQEGNKFPQKDITIVVPWNAGGGNDLMARKLQAIFKDELGISVVVKNAPGGNGVVGITEVASSKPDGYTLGVHTSSTLSVIALGQASLKSDKLTNIALISEDPLVLVSKADAPWNNMKELVEYMKTKPNQVKVATPGTNNVNHAVAAMLGSSTNVQFQHVPFDGGALVITQLLGGHVDVAVLKPSESMSQIKDGNLKAIAINAEKRIDSLPDVPTFKESGYDLFTSGAVKQISFIVGPAGMDPAIRERLTELFNKAIQSDAYQKFAHEGGFITPKKTGSELDKEVDTLIKALSEAFSKIFKP
ncbi:MULTISPECIES: tripartite tricarboxylate transporter substrate binding protein [unclassified Paenibacillus]|uniref:tripartite tricarboxylate transporter substrate binding protein n=1 Tax=unclassified Paenibacillus TaxID=185978 RepID=UPI0021188E01|nr:MULTISPECIES: tripartite tricarboxylate transporter substrate binding protein [unclassified Paenibacillus]